ncbi:ceramidase domain-containing protein [Ignatzschineria sp. LJL83]
MKMISNTQNASYNWLFYPAVILFFIAFYWIFPSFPQPEDYHYFSGDQTIFGVSNFMNVASNIVYIIAGILGLYRCQKRTFYLPQYRWRFFFISLILVGIGSSYYHFNPSTYSLFWDRLPMGLGFAFLSANFLAERFPVCNDHTPLLLLLGFSVFSIVYWHFSEMIEMGDLRLYAITQFATIGLIGFCLLFRAQSFQMDFPYWILFIGYGIAKVCEMLDPAIFSLSQGFLGGHVIKHLISGIALILFIPPTRRINQPSRH